MTIQILPPPQQQPPIPPLGAPMTRSQYLASALRSMSADAAPDIRNPEALGTNLMAEALQLYGDRQRQQDATFNANQGATDGLRANAAAAGIDPGAAAMSPDGRRPLNRLGDAVGGWLGFGAKTPGGLW